jgi:tetratricopeptide (TPR) repeat protein
MGSERIIRRIVATCLICVGLLNVSRAEETPLDQLKKYSTKNDTIGLKKALGEMNEHFSRFVSAEYGTAIDECIKTAEKQHADIVKDFHTVKAKWYQYNNDVSHAAAEYSKVYDYLKRENKESDGIWILIDIGNLFYAASNFEDAILFYEKAEALSDKFKDKYALSVINLNLGLVQRENGEYSKAVNYFKKCIALRQGTKENAFISHTYIKISETYSLMNKMDSVLYYIQAAEQLYYAEGKNVGILQDMPALIGMAYYKYFSAVGNTRIAETNLMNARSFMRAKELSGRLYDSYITEADIELKAGNSQQVIDSLSPILPKLKDSRYFEFYKEALHLLAKAHFDVDNFNQAKDYYEQFITAEEESLNKRSIQNSAVAGLLDRSTKAASLSNSPAQQKKSPLATILLILLGASLMLSFYLYSKLATQKKRISELKRELERQHTDFTDKIRKRMSSSN